MKFKHIDNNFSPKCPSCKKVLDEVLVMSYGMVFIKSALVCPHCYVLLGFGEQNLF